MNLTEEKIKKMIAGCCNNESWAHESLYKTFHGEMVRVCYTYLADKSLAKEAYNTGCLKVFQSIKSYDTTKGEFGGWIRRIMINTSIDLSRKELKFNSMPSTELDDNSFFINPIVLEKLYAEDLFTAIGTLPIATQTVFNLSVIDGYSHKEICDKLLITEGTSRWHLSEAKRRLRELIDKSGNLLDVSSGRSVGRS